jgi:hypothetical protein
MRRSLLLVLSLMAASAIAAAQGPPMSPEIPVNPLTTGNQFSPSVAIDGNGNFVVAWDSNQGSGYDVSARRFDAGGNPLSGEFTVNTYTTGAQYNGAVASDRFGNFVVVWTSYGQLTPNETDVFARRYDAAGNPLSGEFLVNTYTTGNQYTLRQSVAMSASGEFLVVWGSNGQDGDGWGVFGQRFDSSGNKLGSEFQVNTYTTGSQTYPVAAINESREFVVAWQSYGQDGDSDGVFARRYDAAGNPVGGEIAINTHTTGRQSTPVVGIDRSGNFVVVWDSLSQDGSLDGIFGRRFDNTGAPLTGEFQVNTHTSSIQEFPSIAMDRTGNFVCTWESYQQDGSLMGVFAQAFDHSTAKVGNEFQVNTYTTGGQYSPVVAMKNRDSFVIAWPGFEGGTASDIYARVSAPGAQPAAVDAHTVAGTASNTNGVLEAGETVQVNPAYRNDLASSFPVTGTATNLTGPPGPTYTLDDTSADYGTIGAGATTDCFGATGDCYLVTVSGARPAAHWDATLDETLSTGVNKTWLLHVGESFPDVPTSLNFYAYIENLFHNGVTGGCGGGNYCPGNSVTRAQMAVFLLKSKHLAGYVPPPCTGIFGDVTCPSQFADWIEQLSAEGITGGCGGGNYCPNNPVTRAQMAVFLLKAEHGSSYLPPACAGIFGDVTCPSQFADWIERLAAENITGGCGGGNYCPNNPNTRGQMAVFLVKTFGLQLYGP